MEEYRMVLQAIRISGGLDGFYQCPTTEELLELAKAIEDTAAQTPTSVR